MSRRSSIKGFTAAGAAVALALGAGYWLGQSTQVPPAAVPSSAASSHAGRDPAPAVQPPVAKDAMAARTILYYQDPTGKPEYSAEPKKDAEGRDYVPVYSDPGTTAQAPTSTPAPSASSAPRRILYYRNAMGLPDTSPVPKKDSMGMDYVPVYEGEDDGGSVLKLSLDKVQKLGVRTAPVEERALTHTVRAVGTVQVDERLQQLVAPKFEGYVERLYVDTTGAEVRKGQALMDIYSPELVLAEQEYVAAHKALRELPTDASPEARDAAGALADGALLRLRNWDIPRAEVENLKRSGKVSRTLALPSLVSGVVLEKKVIQGQRFMPGEVLYSLADLSTVWVIAEVFEGELSYVRVGQEAKITFNALPGMTFTGKVTFIYPTLSPETRTVKVRIELPNPDGRLRPALYGAVEIATAADDRKTLAVPESALLDTGTRKVVLIDRGDGLFEPRDVEIGARADGYVEVLGGVSANDKVVVSANFLIDAESNLRAALQSFKK